MYSRLLHSSDLPECLWQPEQDCLHIPEVISKIYEQMLEEKELLELARNDTSTDGPVGGVTEDATNKHFATRFSASVARTQLTILDPKEDLRNVSDLFIQAFSGGTISLLDIPCGAGAASACLLGTIAALREAHVVPRQPLIVKLLCGDLSWYARDYAENLIAGMQNTLRCQAIFVEARFTPWNVLDPFSTSGLLYDWMEFARGCREYFIVTANFSGFLQKENKLNEAKPQLSEVFRWAEKRRSTVMWLEPKTNEAVEGLWPRVFKLFKGILPPLFRSDRKDDKCLLSSECRYRHPIISNCTPRVNLTLTRLEVNEK